MNWNNVIFLAYASEDKPVVRELYNTLLNRGLSPWLDEENLIPGVLWEDKIKEAIRNARFFIACLTANSVSKSGFIQRELRMALQELERKPPGVLYFIPALMEDVELPNLKVGSINLRDYQAAKIYDQQGIDKLVQHLWQETNAIVKIKNKEIPDFGTIRELLFDGKVDPALKLMRTWSSIDNRDVGNTFVLLSSRFSHLRKQNALGLITSEEFQKGRNGFVFSILEALDIIEEKKMQSIHEAP